MKALRYHARRPTGENSDCGHQAVRHRGGSGLGLYPGVATPCRAIQRHPDSVYRYTNKGNLVAIVSNGTAVLGLGNLGPLAAKPVMEGKSLLFKRLADIDAFDLELDVVHPKSLVRVVTAVAPTFGGINLEDIKAPECFAVEEALRDALPIPVFHDDQHGTAIVVGAPSSMGWRFNARLGERARGHCWRGRSRHRLRGDALRTRSPRTTSSSSIRGQSCIRNEPT